MHWHYPNKGFLIFVFKVDIFFWTSSVSVHIMHDVQWEPVSLWHTNYCPLLKKFHLKKYNSLKALKLF